MNHRVLRVNELIRRELGTIFEKNFTFSGSLVTIHDVQVTPDLKQCFVYVGVIGKGMSSEDVLKKLSEKRGSIQRDLFKRVILKNSPVLTFRADTSIERGVRVLNIIESLPEIPDDPEPTEGTLPPPAE
jgi:ribosome-binding factor A